MRTPQSRRDFDYILVGGGLQSGLIALALRHHRPDSSVLLIERDSRIGGNHTWSFHPGDVPESSRPWVNPIIKHTWPQYVVRVGGLGRRVDLGYAAVPSDHFAEVVSGLFHSEPNESDAPEPLARVRGDLTGEADPRGDGLGETTSVSAGSQSPPVGLSEPEVRTGSWEVMKNTEVIRISDDTVLTSCEKVLRGELVIDCRGPFAGRQPFAGCGYQKFFGFEVELKDDWSPEVPVVMDAVEDQSDGFRFFYILPFSSRRLLVEDTRFSDTPIIDRGECLARVTNYLEGHGIFDFEIIREESGVLPMPFTSELRPDARSPLAGGYAGGWFHAATGYSFPLAVAFAEAVSSVAAVQARKAVRELAEGNVWRSGYARFLNRLLFRLVAPRHRYRIFRRFYRVLSDRAIERFYSHRFTVGDATRIVVGVPPTVLGLRPLRFMRSFFLRDIP